MLSSLMRLLSFISLMAIAAFGQTAPPWISSDIAITHLIKSPQADYPPKAELARIQGNVIIEIKVDTSGTALVARVVSGHPLLVPAAVNAVNRWKYQPFEVDGKPATVRTVVLVAFGNAAYYETEGRVGMRFQNDFWTAEESAEAKLAKKDYAGSEEQLNRIRDLISSGSNPSDHLFERWQWMTTMGQLRKEQKNYAEAELYYKKALELHENKWEDKNSPSIAVSLANLAALFMEENRPELARDNGVRALEILEKNFKRAGGGNPGARQSYGRAIEQESSLLLKLAKERADVSEINKQCRTISDFQSFLDSADRNSVLSACQVETTKQVNEP